MANTQIRHPLAALARDRLEHPQHRVVVEQIENTARLQEAGYHLRPSLQVRQPAEHTQRGVNNVERFVQHRRQVIHVALDETRPQAEFGVQPPSRGDGDVREVHTGGAGAEPAPRHRVQPEVALQMQEGLVGDVPHLAPLDVVQRDAPRLEAGHVVERRGRMHRNALVPVAAVGLQPVVHAPSAVLAAAAPTAIVAEASP